MTLFQIRYKEISELPAFLLSVMSLPIQEMFVEGALSLSLCQALDSWPKTDKIPDHRASAIKAEALTTVAQPDKDLGLAMVQMSQNTISDNSCYLSSLCAYACCFIVTRQLPHLQALSPHSRQEEKEAEREGFPQIFQNMGLPDKIQAVQLNVSIR